MGMGIALVAARVTQLPVVVVDSNSQQLERGFKFVASLLDKDISKGKCTASEKDAVLARLVPASKIDSSSFGDVDCAIEAVSENLDLKQRIFRDLDAAMAEGNDKILATNTSSISITKIAASINGSTRRDPSTVVGMHFMNPVPVMKLVEVIPGLATAQSTLDATLDLAHRMGKTTTLSRDTPGFIANRLLMPYINEAVTALEAGIGTREDIDTTMKLGTNMPMGPLTLADFIGLDTCLAIMKVLHGELGDSKYRPAVLLGRYVDAGWLGKKSGRGFYEYK
ncbi:hypothetical protein GQ42DRAFT_124889 [Ramicandelaber brevisporus]|nr:hypothetical protein GQ42DRAFT_124889 [Ramicandelaber brevisporus]